MPDQNTAQPSAPPAEAPKVETKPNPMEQVYKTYNIEETAQSFQQPSQQPAAQPAVPPKVPDPFSPDYPAFQQQQAQGLMALHQGVSDIKREQAQLRASLQHERTEADISRAVGVLAEKSGIDPDIAEVAFQAEAKRDPKLLAIWNNRGKNPKALSAALEAFSGVLKERYTVRQDPQLLENQRAVRASQQQMATTQKQGHNSEWENMTAAERQAKVQQLIRRG